MAGLTGLVRSDEAVSPVIAMVLILFIVTTAIGVVYMTGLPRIESAKEGAHMQNMKSAFIVLQGDIKEVAQAPSTTGQARLTKMKMDKGFLKHCVLSPFLPVKSCGGEWVSLHIFVMPDNAYEWDTPCCWRNRIADTDHVNLPSNGHGKPWQ